MNSWRFFRPNAIPSTDELNSLNRFELKTTKLPTDATDAIDSLLNVETALDDRFKEIVGDFCAGSIDDNSPVMVAYRSISGMLAARVRHHNEQTVKLDYYRSKAKQLLTKRAEIETVSHEITTKTVRVQHFSVNYERNLDAQCELLSLDLRDILLDRLFDFKFGVDLKKHSLHFVLGDPLTKELIYFQCRFAQREFEAGMIYTILLEFYRARKRDRDTVRALGTVPVTKRFFNAKAFLETINSLPNSYRFFF